MKSLSDILLAPGNKEAAIGDLAHLLESTMASRGGLTGMAMKTGLSMLKAAKPDVMQRGATRMLPEFASALQPLFERFQASGGKDFAAFLAQNSTEATRIIAQAADHLMSTSQNATAKSLFARFRGGAEKDIAAMVPQVGKLFQKYLG
ncbi:MAG TPA: hypothetical protein VLI06_16880 [Solimonas sp.]|nr:hypothetical protein [Solimonas sp.]